MLFYPLLRSGQEIVIYPLFVRLQRKGSLRFTIGIVIFALATAIWAIATHQKGSVLIYWIILIACVFSLIALFLQLTWGSLLVINEQGMRIRTNPLLKSIVCSWHEVGSLKLLQRGRRVSLYITLLPAHRETFLQRQPFLIRRMLSRNLNQEHPFIQLPQWQFPWSLTAVLSAIQDRYRTQIQQHHITITFLESGG
jgi:hypothetical protein